MRIHMAALAELADQLDDALPTDKTPTDTLEVPKLSEKSFRRVVEGNYTIEKLVRPFHQNSTNFSKKT
jgi:hypothetical protein